MSLALPVVAVTLLVPSFRSGLGGTCLAVLALIPCSLGTDLSILFVNDHVDGQDLRTAGGL